MQARSATGCDPMLAERPARDQAVVPLHSGARVVRSVSLPAQTSVLVFVREGDLDVTMEVRKAGVLVGRSDTSIHRYSVQRVAFTTVQGAEHTLALSAKQSSGAGDSVDVRVVALPRAASDELCVSAQQKLAAADQAYALAHDVTPADAQKPAADLLRPTSLQRVPSTRPRYCLGKRAIDPACSGAARRSVGLQL